MRITLPDIVELPEPRVGDDGWSRDVGKTRLESIREQAENHCCKDERGRAYVLRKETIMTCAMISSSSYRRGGGGVRETGAGNGGLEKIINRLPDAKQENGKGPLECEGQTTHRPEHRRGRPRGQVALCIWTACMSAVQAGHEARYGIRRRAVGTRRERIDPRVCGVNSGVRGLRFHIPASARSSDPHTQGASAFRAPAVGCRIRDPNSSFR